MSTAIEMAPAFELEEFHLDDLHVDDRYQRPLTDFYKTIVSNFNPALCQPLAVSVRDNGEAFVIDGQNRLTALRELGVRKWPCMVYRNLSPSDEATLFAEFQRERRPLRPWDRFRAELFAGDTHASEIVRIVQDCGFELQSSADHPNGIAAIVSIETVYKRGGEELLRDVLNTIAKAWPYSATGRDGAMIRGLSAFILRSDNVNLDRLREHLSRVSPEEIRRRALALQEGYGGGTSAYKYVAHAIGLIYR
jgi:hypothetical protein